ncbi:hypothetical protein [Methanogenium cariaci]
MFCLIGMLHLFRHQIAVSDKNGLGYPFMMAVVYFAPVDAPCYPTTASPDLRGIMFIGDSMGRCRDK